MLIVFIAVSVYTFTMIAFEIAEWLSARRKQRKYESSVYIIFAPHRKGHSCPNKKVN